MTTMTREAISPDLAYEKMGKLLYSIAHSYNRKFGGDFEEILSEVHEHFMTAVNSYKPAPDDTSFQGTQGGYHIGGWVKLIVWQRLKDSWKKRHRFAMRFHRIDPTINDEEGKVLCGLSCIANRERFDIGELIRSLSGDAAFVVQSVVQHCSTGHPAGKRKRLVGILKELGWAGGRIVESFREIKEALS